MFVCLFFAYQSSLPALKVQRPQGGDIGFLFQPFHCQSIASFRAFVPKESTKKARCVSTTTRNKTRAGLGGCSRARDTTGAQFGRKDRSSEPPRPVFPRQASQPADRRGVSSLGAGGKISILLSRRPTRPLASARPPARPHSFGGAPLTVHGPAPAVAPLSLSLSRPWPHARDSSRTHVRSSARSQRALAMADPQAQKRARTTFRRGENISALRTPRAE